MQRVVKGLMYVLSQPVSDAGLEDGILSAFCILSVGMFHFGGEGGGVV